MKYFTIVFFSLIFILKLQASDFQVNGINYKITGDTTVGIAQYGATKYSGEITIPEYIQYAEKNYLVTSVLSLAFHHCTALTNIKLPNSVTNIEWAAFEGCTGLKSLNLPESLVSTGGFSFSQCVNLLQVNFPKSLKHIGSSSFAGCSGLTRIILPDSIITIGSFAFDYCYRITEINLPKTITFIGGGAFNHCRGLTEIELPELIKTIGGHTFAGCENIEHIVIPNAVESIGDYAFEYCYGLTSITLPDSLISLGAGVFNGCNRLATISLPNTLTLLGSEAFVNCTRLAEIILPNSIRTIEKGTFSGCTALSRIVLPNALEAIDNLAFYNCTNLNDCFNLPPTLTRIGNNAFTNCIKLNSLILPPSVTKIGYEAFFNCTGLKYLLCTSKNPPQLTDDIFNIKDAPVIYTPANHLSFYKSANFWKNYKYSVGSSKSIICGNDTEIASQLSEYLECHNIQYKWYPSTGLSSDTAISPTFLLPTSSTYIIELSTPLFGIIATDTIKIQVNPLIVNIDSQKVISCGESVKFTNLNTNYKGAGLLKYKWHPSTGLDNDTIALPTCSVTSDTEYTLTVSTPNGCFASNKVFVKVNPLIVNIDSQKVITCGGSVKFSNLNTNYTGSGLLKYKWLPSTGLDNDTIALPTSSVTSDTEYTLTVSTPNGCIASNKVFVKVNIFTIDAGPDIFFQCGDSVLLNGLTTNYTGSGILKYKWSSAAGLINDTISNPMAVITENTKFTITVITPEGCSSTDSISLYLSATPSEQIRNVTVDSNLKNAISWEVLNPQRIDSVYIYKLKDDSEFYTKIGSAPYLSARFIDTMSSPDIGANKYKISMLDMCKTESQTSDPHKTIYLKTQQIENNKVKLSWELYVGFPVATYNIYRGTSNQNLVLFGFVNGDSIQFIDNNPPPINAFYQVEAVSKLSNVNSKSNISAVLKTSRINPSVEDSFAFVYPNPAQRELFVSFNDYRSAKLNIYNMTGVLVRSESISGNLTKINVSDLTNSVYIIEIKSDDKIYTNKIIIQN